MRAMLMFIIAGTLLLTGCAQVGDVAGETRACLEKCQDVCDLVKDSNLSLDGYDEIRLTKKEGPVTTYCGCQCSS